MNSSLGNELAALPKVGWRPRLNIPERLAWDELEKPHDVLAGAVLSPLQGLQGLQLPPQVVDGLGDVQAGLGHVEDHLVLSVREQQVVGVSLVGDLENVAMRPHLTSLVTRLLNREVKISVVVAVEFLDSLGSEAVQVGEETAGLLGVQAGPNDLTRAEDVS